MQKMTCKDSDLDQLDKAFGLTQIWECDLLAQLVGRVERQRTPEKSIIERLVLVNLP